MLAELAGPAIKQQTAEPAGAFLSEWRTAPREKSRALLLDYLKKQTAAVMGGASPDSLDPRQGLTTLGLDSLMAVELKVRLETGLGLRLPATLTFEHPNLEALSAFLAAELDPQPAAPAHAPEVFQSSPELSRLTEDQISELLAERIESAFKATS